MDIAKYEDKVDYDVLIAACLLHDIGRKEQFEDPKVCHAAVGADKAYNYLIEHHWGHSDAQEVKACIIAHRFRTDHIPESIESKILFDADKLDVTGTLGIARTLLYKGYVSEALYLLKEDGSVSDGSDDDKPSFFQEYKFKLENLYDKFYTRRGIELSIERQKSAVDFYNNMLREVRSSYALGKEQLNIVYD